MRTDAVRARVCGNAVTYVVNRNINNTNVCTFSCAFCAFSKVHVDQHTDMLPRALFLKSVCAALPVSCVISLWSCPRSLQWWLAEEKCMAYKHTLACIQASL